MNDEEKAVNATVLADITRARTRQNQLWGVQRLDWTDWMVVLSEGARESAHASLDAQLNPGQSLALLREKLIQVAAVAVAMIEHIGEIGVQDRT